MKRKRTLGTGLQLAIGMFIGSALLYPAVFGEDWGRSLGRGTISAVLVFLLYALVVWWDSRNSPPSVAEGDEK